MYSFLARDWTRHWPPPSQRSILAKSVSSSAWNQMPQIFETPSVVFRCLIFTVRMGFLSLTWQMRLGVFYEVSSAWISKSWFTNSKLIELNACSVSLTEYTSLQSLTGSGWVCQRFCQSRWVAGHCSRPLYTSPTIGRRRTLLIEKGR